MLHLCAYVSRRGRFACLRHVVAIFSRCCVPVAVAHPLVQKPLRHLQHDLRVVRQVVPVQVAAETHVHVILVRRLPQLVLRWVYLVRLQVREGQHCVVARVQRALADQRKRRRREQQLGHGGEGEALAVQQRELWRDVVRGRLPRRTLVLEPLRRLRHGEHVLLADGVVPRKPKPLLEHVEVVPRLFGVPFAVRARVPLGFLIQVLRLPVHARAVVGAGRPDRNVKTVLEVSARLRRRIGVVLLAGLLLEVRVLRLLLAVPARFEEAVRVAGFLVVEVLFIRPGIFGFFVFNKKLWLLPSGKVVSYRRPIAR
mmetsp:Transcript_23086/g.58332  ORF Transcript_23086/g.58332 Transcript_23086/m.58332 type:complete len:312 (-) Transcript_23086:873-1808(-)